MAFYKTFPGHWTRDPYHPQHKANMQAAGWIVKQAEPIVWEIADGSRTGALMGAFPVPDEEDGTNPRSGGMWFVGGLNPEELGDEARVAAFWSLVNRPVQYIVDGYNAAAGNCLYEGCASDAVGGGYYRSVSEARAAGDDEVKRVAELAEDERDEFDWVVGYTVRPCLLDEAGDEALLDPALELNLRVLMGYRLAEILAGWLQDMSEEKLRACVEGERDPCDFCDDNFATAQAYAEVFAHPMDAGIPAHAQRANAATKVAAKVIRCEGYNIALLRYMARKDDPVGLAHTITRNEAHPRGISITADVDDLDTCTDPRGHRWVCQDTDEICGEGRSYCEHCGADGDA